MDLMDEDFSEFEQDLIRVTQRALAILGRLIRETDLPNVRTEQEADMLGRLLPAIFTELWLHETGEEDDDT
jgi:hypothetical protein